MCFFMSFCSSVLRLLLVYSDKRPLVYKLTLSRRIHIVWHHRLSRRLEIRGKTSAISNKFPESRTHSSTHSIEFTAHSLWHANASWSSWSRRIPGCAHERLQYIKKYINFVPLPHLHSLLTGKKFEPIGPPGPMPSFGGIWPRGLGAGPALCPIPFTP